MHHCRLYCTVVHAHHVRVCTSGPRVRACIGMVRSPKANFPMRRSLCTDLCVTGRLRTAIFCSVLSSTQVRLAFVSSSVIFYLLTSPYPSGCRLGLPYVRCCPTYGNHRATAPLHRLKDIDPGPLLALVHGYASKPDLARLVNLFHAQIAALRCWFYGDWVPSKANPADVPTRAERLHEVPPSATWVEMVLPALEAVERNVSAWIREVRAHVLQSRADQGSD